MPSKPLPSHLLSRTCHLTFGASDKRLFTSTSIFPIAVKIPAKPGSHTSSDSFSATEGVTFDMLIPCSYMSVPSTTKWRKGPSFPGALGGLAQTGTADGTGPGAERDSAGASCYYVHHYLLKRSHLPRLCFSCRSAHLDPEDSHSRPVLPPRGNGQARQTGENCRGGLNPPTPLGARDLSGSSCPPPTCTVGADRQAPRLHGGVTGVRQGLLEAAQRLSDGTGAGKG